VDMNKVLYTFVFLGGLIVGSLINDRAIAQLVDEPVFEPFIVVDEKLFSATTTFSTIERYEQAERDQKNNNEIIKYLKIISEQLVEINRKI